MEYLPPVGWNDVARRHDLELLRAEMHTGFSELRAEMHQQFARQLMWSVGTMIASVGAVVAVLGYLG